MTESTMPKAYEPKEHEPEIYRKWESSDAFHAAPNANKTPFTIIIPPPNVTGILHMGHVLNIALQDIMIRFKRMQGYEALWQPGTDHAGIATQNVLEKELRKEGKTRHDLGREAFIKRVWEWREEKGGYILEQLKRVGASCDWDRTRFTMEPDLSRAVTEVFIRLYQKGLIYRGEYVVNWCPRCQTALSDEEVEHKEEASQLWYIRYPIDGEENTFVTVATTRPETMLGDTAVAIHPDNAKTAHLKGKTAVLPFIGRKIPIIEDDYVEAEFGAGALKVTPAHDPNDFEIGQRHGLEAVTILTEDARINENGGEFAGLDRFEARKTIVEKLEAMGLLEKIEDNPNKIGRCQRCHTVVEPRISLQWFVKMKPLAEPALEAYQNGEVEFIPEHWGKTYTHWLGKIRDWVISRQLWWGHRIPVYYCGGCKKEIAAREAPKTCPGCGGGELEQDPDVLDTWFSSWLWPFTTLGWPDETEDLKYFYPTHWLATGPDIIFFWVARMIMSGLEFTGRVPFSRVYFHGIVRDGQGRRMSKSLGNSPDPIDIIETYGSDALRFTMIALAPMGQDVKFEAKKTELGRNFANKIWNASRFLLMNLEGFDRDAKKADPDPVDRWILSRLDATTKTVTQAFEESRFSDAAWSLYDFVWKEYCDWYLEFAKTRFYGDDAGARSRAQDTAVSVMERALALSHPLFPFLTERIWEYLPTTDGLLVRASWPEPTGESDPTIELRIQVLQNAITAVRNLRAELNITPGTEVSLVIKADAGTAEILNQGAPYMASLARVKEMTVEADAAKPPKSASAVVDGVEIYLPLVGVIDLDVERQRLEKKRAELGKGLLAVDKKLENEGFVSRAPAEVVTQERERRERLAADLAVVERNLTALTDED